MAENETKSKRKAPGLDDPFERAPPKPDGDLWTILLKPEMEADKIRCDAWDDEVQNLLIFAGLFSAVVTAFVIESYKFLQPDPNDTIIKLLSEIANGPNTTSSPLTAGTLSSMVTSFTPTPSSVRINMFWFISLIFSLTTVLVGTIALQWLREHRAYPGLSPKETLAMLHMRSAALEAWYVPQIFSTLPLLLQGALVLFLAGLIDFTLPLGVKLTAPVACIVGLILLFLAVTTTLPAFQPLFLLSGYFSCNAIPTPCPFKSPQSQVFRTLSGIILHFLSFIFPTIYLRANMYWYGNILPDDSDQRHLFPHIYHIWHQKTWSTFDSEWLSLRDAWHHGILDKDPNLYSHRQEWEDLFPLSDITQCLVKTTFQLTSSKHAEEYLVAACYCFQEISASIWKSRPKMFGESYRRDRRNNYFEQLYQRHMSGVCSTSKFLLHGGQYKYDALHMSRFDMDGYSQKHSTLFFLDQVSIFLDGLLGFRTAPGVIDHYQMEIQSRVIRNLLMSDIKPLVPIEATPDIETSSVFPTCFTSYFEGTADFIYLSDDRVDLFTTTFQTAASDSDTKGDRSINPLYINMKVMSMALESLARGIILDLEKTSENPESFNHKSYYGIGEKYGPIFHSVAKHLSDEIIGSENLIPSHLFSLSAMLIHYFLSQLVGSTLEVNMHTTLGIKGSGFIQGLTGLLDAVTRYKQHMAGGQSVDSSKLSLLEYCDYTRVREHEDIVVDFIERFSDEWWTAFFRNYDNSGLRSIEQGPVVSSTPHNIASQPLTSAPDKPHASVPDTAPGSLPLATSPQIHSETITDIVIASSLTPCAPPSHIPSAIVDVPPFEQTVEDLIGADAELPLSSPPSPSEIPIRSSDHPNYLTTPKDSIIDVQTSS